MLTVVVDPSLPESAPFFEAVDPVERMLVVAQARKSAVAWALTRKAAILHPEGASAQAEGACADRFTAALCELYFVGLSEFGTRLRIAALAAADGLLDWRDLVSLPEDPPQ